MGRKRKRRPPFDLDELDTCAREIWDEFFADSTSPPALLAWSFAYACMLMCEGPPHVVMEALRKHDPDNHIGRYQENVRRARDRGELRL